MYCELVGQIKVHTNNDQKQKKANFARKTPLILYYMQRFFVQCFKEMFLQYLKQQRPALEVYKLIISSLLYLLNRPLVDTII